MKIYKKNNIFTIFALIISINVSADWDEYPKRWVDRNNMPLIETMDHIELPYNFGYGSDTRKRWIEDNIAKDTESGLIWEIHNVK